MTILREGMQGSKVLTGCGRLLRSVRPYKRYAGEKVCPAGGVLRRERRAKSTSSAVRRMCFADLTAACAFPFDCD